MAFLKRPRAQLASEWEAVGGLDPPWQGLFCSVWVTHGPRQAGVCGRRSGCPGLEKRPLMGSEGFLVHSLTST